MSDEKAKRGPKPHQPNDETRDSVKVLSSIGMKQDEIGKVLRMTAKTLRKHYRHELDTGRDAIIGELASMVVQKARQGDNASIFFFLKTQGGWRETGVIDHTSSDKSMTPNVINLVAQPFPEDFPEE